MIRFKYFLEDNKTGSLTVFDIDETLFHTTAEVAVVKGGKVVRKLSNQQFNTYKLGHGEEFDFEEFSDSEKFNQESKPVTRMLAKAKAILSHSIKNSASKVIIITARKDFNDKHLFLDTFRKYGFDIDKVYVHRAGNMPEKISTAAKKAKIVSQYLDTGKFGKARLFDDDMPNLTAFLALKETYPDVQFEAYLVNSAGSTKTIK